MIIEIGHSKLPLSMDVDENLNFDMLLGLDFMQFSNIVIDMEKKCLKFGSAPFEGENKGKNNDKRSYNSNHRHLKYFESYMYLKLLELPVIREHRNGIKHQESTSRIIRK